MPIEIRRFGVGHRRPEGRWAASGVAGVTGGPIHSDARGAISELAFARGAALEPHANPNPSYFVVIEGGGWVGVGDERTRVAAGEAVVWPADVPHAAWTEHSEMRALVVEFGAGGEPAVLQGTLADRSAAGVPIERGEGRLVTEGSQPRHDPEAGEPA